MKRIIALIALLALSVPGWGAPSISSYSGEWTHGGNVTISGTGFGSKSPAAPVIWDTFTRGSETNTADIGTWDTPSLYWNEEGMGIENSVVYSPPYSVSGSTSGHYIRLIKELSLVDGSKFFASMKRRKSTSIYGTNTKVWSCVPTTSGGYPRFIISQLDNAGFHTIESLVWGGYHCCPVSNGDTGGAWHHDELVFQRGSAINVADGVVHYTIDNVSILDETEMPTRTNAYPNHMDCVFFDNQGTQTGMVYMDDAYLDTTWARVAIGNASTWANCTQRELQIPSAWSSTSITVEVNTGAFAGTETVYLYVFDSDNSVNATGYEITLGDEGTPAPTPPTLSNVTISGGSFR